ncbi:MAG: flagellar basal body protein [Epulopiscium sp. Nele67-Bin002]|nr:MAG: flagellar basal body protein [Epulopiscium sp. Nele67-Bin001]OON91827.1 MAG: flagellar basal body protein [Epulopiscium sp. Nele67-Bin002]
MVRGLYIAGTGMNVQATRMDVISNDLANVNTTGYKKDVAVIESFPEVLMKRLGGTQSVPNLERSQTIPPLGAVTIPLTTIGSMNYGAKVQDIYIHFAQGSFINTGKQTDIALQNEGFFVVNTPDGEKLTRDGSLVVGTNGDLLTQEGYNVMGQEGPVNLGEDFFTSSGQFEINEFGQVRRGEGILDTIRLVTVDDLQLLEKLDDNLYTTDQDFVDTAGTTRIIQGYLESSNVNVVSAMVDMITVSRAYESNQKMVQVHDDLMSKAVNEVGKA